MDGTSDLGSPLLLFPTDMMLVLTAAEPHLLMAALESPLVKAVLELSPSLTVDRLADVVEGPVDGPDHVEEPGVGLL